MSLAKDMNEEVKSLMELMLTPVKVTRAGTGAYSVRNVAKEEDLGSFGDFGALEKFLKDCGATVIPEDKLGEADVDLEIPCEAIRMEMLHKGEQGGGQDFK
jgi:hypothetical protein